jgi:hypothetical protein
VTKDPKGRVQTRPFTFTYRHLRQARAGIADISAGMRSSRRWCSQACGLRWRDVDLAAGRLRISDSKTHAGRRDVELLAPLREALATHKACAARRSRLRLHDARRRAGRARTMCARELQSHGREGTPEQGVSGTRPAGFDLRLLPPGNLTAPRSLPAPIPCRTRSQTLRGGCDRCRSRQRSIPL